MRFKPIMAFEFILDGEHQVYHTDGKNLVGPSYKPYDPDPMLLDKPEILVSYVSITDPDNRAMVWYQPIFKYNFKDHATMKNALADLILDFKVVYVTFLAQCPFKDVYPIAKYFGKFIPKYPTLKELKPNLFYKNPKNNKHRPGDNLEGNTA